MPTAFKKSLSRSEHGFRKERGNLPQRLSLVALAARELHRNGIRDANDFEGNRVSSAGQSRKKVCSPVACDFEIWRQADFDFSERSLIEKYFRLRFDDLPGVASFRNR